MSAISAMSQLQLFLYTTHDISDTASSQLTHSVLLEGLGVGSGNISGNDEGTIYPLVN
jgi:hypothetical protein